MRHTKSIDVLADLVEKEGKNSPYYVGHLLHIKHLHLMDELQDHISHLVDLQDKKGKYKTS